MRQDIAKGKKIYGVGTLKQDRGRARTARPVEAQLGGGKEIRFLDVKIEGRRSRRAGGLAPPGAHGVSLRLAVFARGAVYAMISA